MFIDLFLVGCLDKDIEGLLIIMNDGIFVYNLFLFKKYIDKIYYVKIDGDVILVDVEVFVVGIEFDDGYICKLVCLEIIILNEINVII